MTPKKKKAAQATREKIDKLEFMNIKTIMSQKDIAKEVKRQPTDREKCL